MHRTTDRLTLLLTLAGLLISGYLTLLHYDSSVPLVCSAGSYVNCETVLTSPSATVAGVPVAVWGLVWFGFATLFALALVSAGARTDSPTLGELRRVALVWTVAGVVGVMYLVYQEVGVIGKICAWCTAVHVIIVLMLIVQASSLSPGSV